MNQTVVTRHTITNGKNNRPIFTLHLLAREKGEKVYNHPLRPKAADRNVFSFLHPFSFILQRYFFSFGFSFAFFLFQSRRGTSKR